MNFTVTEDTVSVLDRLQKDLRDLIESLTAQTHGDSPIKGQTPAAVQTHGDSPIKGQTPVKEQAPEVTLEEVRKVLVSKAREGKNDAIRELLKRFRASALPEINPADYAEVLKLGKEL